MSELKQIEEIAQVKQGRYTSPNELSEKPTEHSKVPVWGANGILGYTQNATYEEAQPLVTCRGNGCGLIQWSGGRAHISNNAMAIVLPDQSRQSSKYLYYSLLNTDFTGVTTGSAQPQITMRHLNKKEIFRLTNPDERTAIPNILAPSTTKSNSTTRPTKPWRRWQRRSSSRGLWISIQSEPRPRAPHGVAG